MEKCPYKEVSQLFFVKWMKWMIATDSVCISFAADFKQRAITQYLWNP